MKIKDFQGFGASGNVVSEVRVTVFSHKNRHPVQNSNPAGPKIQISYSSSNYMIFQYFFSIKNNMFRRKIMKTLVPIVTSYNFGVISDPLQNSSQDTMPPRRTSLGTVPQLINLMTIRVPPRRVGTVTQSYHSKYNVMVRVSCVAR